MGISRKLQRFIHEEVDEETALILDSAIDVDEDSNADAEDSSVLERLRRGGDVQGKSGREGGKGEYEARPHDWHTFKYRPIMGVVLVGEDGEAGPEVAVVERPAWEAGLPGRFEGEWRDREVGL
jgi:U3 small nucleolar RNA-associated protein 4